MRCAGRATPGKSCARTGRSGGAAPSTPSNQDDEAVERLDVTGQGRPPRILVLTGGHRVDLDALFEMMAAICDARGWLWAHARQPSAQAWLQPAAAGAWDAVF